MDNPDSRRPFLVYLSRLIVLTGNQHNRTIAQFTQQTEPYISKILSGKTPNPGSDKLQQIASGLAELMI